MHEVPVLILLCVNHGRVTGSHAFSTGDPVIRGRYASSIYLAAQNLFLAARALGLGTRFTGAHIRGESSVKALLGIPDQVETVMLTPLGYPRHPFGPTNRRPASEFTHYNSWGQRGK